MFPRETSKFRFPSSPNVSLDYQDSGENKTNCFPRDHTLSVYLNHLALDQHPVFSPNSSAMATLKE